jgi:hypothetical protein
MLSWRSGPSGAELWLQPSEWRELCLDGDAEAAAAPPIPATGEPSRRTAASSTKRPDLPADGGAWGEGAEKGDGGRKWAAQRRGGQKATPGDGRWVVGTNQDEEPHVCYRWMARINSGRI